jgi:AraC-like DNA-binding protein
VARHESDFGVWESVRRAPHELLRPHVMSYEGYFEQTPSAAVRRHVPSTGVTVIIGFESPLRNSSRHAAATVHQSFVAGLHDAHVITENTGISSGIQVNLTPIGAYRMFGKPMHLITNAVVSIEDAFGPDGPLLVEALHDARAWDLRFDMLDAAITARLLGAREVPPSVLWAWRTIERTAGNASIAGLTDRLGWSRKHLVHQFREHIGLPPKTFARIARFSRAMRIVRSGEELRWTDVAHACGYYDQAHFIRDFSEFAGVAPTRFLDLRLPLGAVAGD